jgi:hypothetical protein
MNRVLPIALQGGASCWEVWRPWLIRVAILGRMIAVGVRYLAHEALAPR